MTPEDLIAALDPATIAAIVVEADRLLGLDDVVARLPAERRKVERLVTEGRIPMFKLGGTWVITRRAFLRAAERGFPLPEGRVRKETAAQLRELRSLVREAVKDGTVDRLRRAA